MTKKKYTTRTPIGSTLNTNIYEELKIYSDETKIPMTKILDMAILQYLSSAKKKTKMVDPTHVNHKIITVKKIFVITSLLIHTNRAKMNIEKAAIPK